jgi:hypothetical protein
MSRVQIVGEFSQTVLAAGREDKVHSSRGEKARKLGADSGRRSGD